MRAVYYEEQLSHFKDENEKKMKMAEDIRDLCARKIIGEKRGLLKDIYYEEYRIRQVRARKARAAFHLWRNKHGKELKKENILEKEGVSFSPEYAAREIESLLGAQKDVSDIRVALKGGTEIKVSDLKKLSTETEWQQLIAQKGTGLQASLREFLDYYLHDEADKIVIKNTNASEKELQVIDTGRVALLYLQVKYGMAGKGIYPGMMLDVAFTPTELYDHFHKIQKSLSDVINVQVQYTVVPDNRAAEEFLEQLNDGKDFAQLAGRYAVRREFVTTARWHLLQGYNRALPLAKREKRGYYDKLFIDMASRDVTEPEPYHGKDGVVLARLRNIKKAIEKVSFEESSWKVKHDLQVQLLKEQYAQDMKDTIFDHDITIHLPPVPAKPTKEPAPDSTKNPVKK